jgi:hypothetical protein
MAGRSRGGVTRPSAADDALATILSHERARIEARAASIPWTGYRPTHGSLALITAEAR